jgi:predicted DNA-binding transcriptional regulator AlpA
MDNQIGFLRLPRVLELIPVSKSAWWAGVKSGKFPASYKLGPRTTAWKSMDIFALVEKLGGEKSNKESTQKSK